MSTFPNLIGTKLHNSLARERHGRSEMSVTQALCQYSDAYHHKSASGELEVTESDPLTHGPPKVPK